MRPLAGVIFVFIIALFLRTVFLADLPYNFHSDEVNAGYVGYKIIKTGSDINNNLLPLYINKFGDFRPAGIFYVNGLFESVFGLSAFTTRFPSAFIGALSVISLFALVNLISGNRRIALLSAILLAISPWHIVVSRATSEQVIALFLLISGAAILLYSFQVNNIKILLAAFLVMLSSYFFYHTPRIFLPAFFILFATFIFFGKKHKENRNFKISLFLLTALIIIFTGVLTFTSFGLGRFSQTSIFSNQEVLDKTRILSDVDQGDIFAARVFHNKPVVFTKEIVNQYLDYFSTQFLFMKGGLPDRYVVPEHGLFYYIELPFILLGFYFIIRRRPRFYFVPLIWIALGPIAASLTLEDSPNVQRALFMLPGFQILGAYGIYYTFHKVAKRYRAVFAVVTCLVFSLSFIYFWHKYSSHADTHHAFSRNAGMRELFELLEVKDSNFSRVYLSSTQDIPIYYHFYNHKNVPFLNIEEGRKDFEVGKYVFVNHDCPEVPLGDDRLAVKSLIVSYTSCSNVIYLENKDIVRRNDGSDIFVTREKNE